MGMSGASLRKLPVRPGRKAVEASARRRAAPTARRKGRVR